MTKKNFFIILMLVTAIYFAQSFMESFFAVDACLDGGGCWDSIAKVCRKDEVNAQELCDSAKSK